jgi:hypothetical protein
VKIAHIINPVNVQKKTELYSAQIVTYASMDLARKWYLGDSEISFFSTQFKEDYDMIPEYITPLSDLNRSVLDVNPKLNGKKLPLIADILEKSNEINAFDYLIYTNVDIALMPQFYSFVVNQISKGHDAIVINRRRLSKKYNFPEDMSLMYSDLGLSHPGFDCFIFKKELIQKFIFNEICIGIPFLEVSFIHNIASFAKNPLYVLNAHLTFHLGTEVLSNRKKDEYYWHNRKNYFNTIQPKLAPTFKLANFPYFNENILLRAIKWGLNPALFTREYLKLEGRNTILKMKTIIDEIRWRILQR